MEKFWVRLSKKLGSDCFSSDPSDPEKFRSKNDQNRTISRRITILCEIEHKLSQFHKKFTYNYFDIFRSLDFRNFSEKLFHKMFFTHNSLIFRYIVKWFTNYLFLCYNSDVWNVVFSEAHGRLLSDLVDDVMRVDVDVEKILEIGLKSQIKACVMLYSTKLSMLFVLECSQKLICEFWDVLNTSLYIYTPTV